MIKLFIGIGVLGLILVGWKLFARSSYETAEYRVLESDGRFEIREYPELVLATTHSVFSAQGKDGSFMRLFNYISGRNDSAAKIEMTTPVFMDSPNEGGEMSFVLPKNMVAKPVPRPTDSAVKITRRPPGRYAVIRFSGLLNEESVKSAEKELRDWAAKLNLKITSDSQSAGYDPPFIPGMLRRNEVLIRIDQG